MFRDPSFAWDKDPRNRQLYVAYRAAESALNASPRGPLIVFIKQLSLIRLNALAQRSDEIKGWLHERMAEIDRARTESFPRHQKTEIPHPLEAILRRTRKGGGTLGYHRMAKELDGYCRRQIAGYARNVNVPGKWHMGLLNTIGVLTAVFTRKKADRKLRVMLGEVSDNSRSHLAPPSMFSPKEIELFLKRTPVTRALSHLSHST